MSNHKSLPGILVGLLFVNWSMQSIPFLVGSLTLLAILFFAGLKISPDSVYRVTNTSLGTLVAIVLMGVSVLLGLLRRGAFD